MNKKRFIYLSLVIVIIIIIGLIFIKYSSFCKKPTRLESANIQKAESILKAKIQALDSDIATTDKELDIVISKFIEKYNNKNDTPKYPGSIYFRDKNGILADHNHKALSNIYVPQKVDYTPDLKKYITSTEDLEQIWQELKNKHTNYGWLYIHDMKTTTIRCFPWFDFAGNFGNELDFTAHRSYQLGHSTINTERALVCTKIYDDMAGMGVMLSCGKPVYINDDHIATAVFDITMQKFLEDITSDLRFLQNFHFFVFCRDSAFSIYSNKFFLSIDFHKFTDFSNIYFRSNTFDYTSKINIKKALTDHLSQDKVSPSKMAFKDTAYNLIYSHSKELNWHIGVLFKKRS